MRDSTILTLMRDPEREALFWSRLRQEGDCLVWTMARNARGYGMFSIGSQGVRYSCSAHRVAWMLANDEVIPDGLVIDHLCGNRACALPDHLEPVTQRENVTRGFGRTLVGAPAVLRRTPGSVQKRVRGDYVHYAAMWREYMADGTVVQRGESFASREEAQARLNFVVIATPESSEAC